MAAAPGDSGLDKTVTLLERYMDAQTASEVGPLLFDIAFVLGSLLLFTLVARAVWSVFKRLGLLRFYLLVLALIEVGGIAGVLVFQHPLDGFAINLKDAPAERRLWCFMLACLMFSRLLAFASPDSRLALAHLAAVHIAELVFMFGEQAAHAEVACKGKRGIALALQLPKGLEVVMRRFTDLVNIANCEGARSPLSC